PRHFRFPPAASRTAFHSDYRSPARGSTTTCSWPLLTPGRRSGPGPGWPTATSRSTSGLRARCQTACLGLKLRLTCPGVSEHNYESIERYLALLDRGVTNRRGSLDRNH